MKRYYLLKLGRAFCLINLLFLLFNLRAVGQLKSIGELSEITPDFLYEISYFNEVTCREFLVEKGYTFDSRYQPKQVNGIQVDGNNSIFYKTYAISRIASEKITISKTGINVTVLKFNRYVALELLDVLKPYKDGESYYYDNGDFITSYIYKTLQLDLLQSAQGEKDILFIIANKRE